MTDFTWKADLLLMSRSQAGRKNENEKGIPLTGTFTIN